MNTVPVLSFRQSWNLRGTVLVLVVFLFRSVIQIVNVRLVTTGNVIKLQIFVVRNTKNGLLKVGSIKMRKNTEIQRKLPQYGNARFYNIETDYGNSIANICNIEIRSFMALTPGLNDIKHCISVFRTFSSYFRNTEDESLDLRKKIRE